MKKTKNYYGYLLCNQKYSDKYCIWEICDNGYRLILSENGVMAENKMYRLFKDFKPIHGSYFYKVITKNEMFIEML